MAPPVNVTLGVPWLLPPETVDSGRRPSPDGPRPWRGCVVAAGYDQVMDEPVNRLSATGEGWRMTTARDLMSDGADFVDGELSVYETSRRMVDLGIGALPVCANGRLVGMVTDRDIVIDVVARGRDPKRVTVGELTRRLLVTVAADADIGEALDTMARHRVRRVPVVDGSDLVGVLSQADVARRLPPERVGALVAAISE
jgi:CBS domain-containing protein